MNPGLLSVLTELPTSQLAIHDGGKVVGMRFAICDDCRVTKCFILNVKDANNIDTLAVSQVSHTQNGWNQVEFKKPFTLNVSDINRYMMGYEYEQTRSNRPIAMWNGVPCANYYYGNLGRGYDFYEFEDDYLVVSVQAIVEKDYPENAVIASDYDDVYTYPDNSANISLTLQNAGSSRVNNVDYVISVDGKAETEKHLDLTDNDISFGDFFYLTIPFNAKYDLGEHDVVVCMTKVNGAPNGCETKNANGLVWIVKNKYKHRPVIEEHTGTGCGYCPLGHQGMHNLRETFGDDFIGIALHRYSNSTRDPMYIDGSSYKHIVFDGAPSARIERGEEIHPYYGSGKDVREDYQNAINSLTYVGVDVTGYWNDDKTKVNATATVEASVPKEYDIEYVLVADDLTGSEKTWLQSNYYNNRAQEYMPDDMKKYGSGGELGSELISGFVYDDVAIASSYSNGTNQTMPLGKLEAYVPEKNTYIISMPVSSLLLNAINYDKVYLIALVVDKSTGKVVNARKTAIDDITGVDGVTTETKMKLDPDAPMYSLSGLRVDSNYKGIVIQNGRKFLKK